MDTGAKLWALERELAPGPAWWKKRGENRYFQLIYYKRAVLFALNSELPVYGTDEQIAFWESMRGTEDLMTMAVFVNRELPQRIDAPTFGD